MPSLSSETVIRTKPKSSSKKQKKWTTAFDTVRRQQLFQNPPTDKSAYPALEQAIQPHTHSFNAIFAPEGLLQCGIREIGTRTTLDGNPTPPADADPIRRNRFSVVIREVFLEKPYLPSGNKFCLTHREIMPSECRERHGTYRGKLKARISYKINNGRWMDSVRELGNCPIMLRTNRCHLEKLTPAQLVEVKEESDELGGYFIINGNEKLIRMLIVARRNLPMSLVRPTYQNRGNTYTKFGVSIRSVRPDETSQTSVLHYLSDGNIIFRFSWRKNEYLVPFMIIAKALIETNDREIFEGILGPAGSDGFEEKQFVMDRVELLLRTNKKYNIHGMAKWRSHLGEKFRVVLGVSDDITDEEAGTEFLRKIVFPHLGCQKVTLSEDIDKFKLLLFMARKLYSLAEGESAPDNPDAASNQEILLPGFLYGMIIKEKLDDWMTGIRTQVTMWLRSHNFTKGFTDPDFEKDLIVKIFAKTNDGAIGQAMEYFLSTGNLVSTSGLDLQQTSGYTVVAEKINFWRFISHFRTVHRGSFFAQMKTTTVRKLLPESWGFLCPVHTPDGSPCGLLNHLAHMCRVATSSVDASNIKNLVGQLGVTANPLPRVKDSVVVQLDGKVLGYCSPKQAEKIHNILRYWKVEGTHDVPLELEIGYIPTSNGGQYPGIFIFSQAGRMFRPVKYLPLDKRDYVGPFEQPFMSIAVTETEIVSGESTHVEYDPTHILSILANQTPFSDFNQSPRNMYQCQMGKQTMGNYGTAIKYRTDNKAYRLQTGQTPVVRPPLHNEYGLDNFPNGTNAVVAVISYTGYDMDDAMIINKSAHERGFAHGTIYKTTIIDIAESNRGRSALMVTKLFGFAPDSVIKAEVLEQLDDDGLPMIGRMLRKGDPLVAMHTVIQDPLTGKFVNQDGQTEFKRYKDDELGFVEEVRLLGSEEGNKVLQKVSIKIRIPRSPTIGDKFSSRHGQKGVCSQKWPQGDMPFTESGISPDVIINPHAFPSRMTIGMFVESLAGKSGALHGLSQDCTPWKFDEKNTAVDFFGHQLMKAGYNYYGNEPMYSGITGKELAADIYIGVVYYQRLRHMVNDKYQVRTTGAINRTTGQPIKGRKKGGGIRVGEMERDALLAHGTVFLLQDRLFNCSDYQMSHICRECGSFLAATPVVSAYGKDPAGAKNNVRCRRCATMASGLESKSDIWQDGFGEKWIGGEDIALVAVPGVLRLLDVELASMGVKMRFNIEP